jgi:flagellar hook protein FlgE
MPISASIFSGVTAMKAFSKGVETISANIANANTTGYKSATVSFSSLMNDSIKNSQGSLSVTGVKTDLAVSGEGFFRVLKTDDNSEYATRAGDFHLDEDGYLVNSSGYQVQGLTGGAVGAAPAAVGSIRVSQTPPAGAELLSFAFDKKGNFTETYSNGTTAVTNRVLLQRYSNPTALKLEGANMFTNFENAAPVGGLALTALGNAPGGVGNGTIEPETLELSNVDLTSEFASLINAQRSLQASSRIVTVSDSMVEDTVNLKR